MSRCTQIFCFYDIFRCRYDFGGGVSESLSEAFQRHVDVALTSGFAGGVLVSATYYSFLGKLYYTVFLEEEKKKKRITTLLTSNPSINQPITYPTSDP